MVRYIADTFTQRASVLGGWDYTPGVARRMRAWPILERPSILGRAGNEATTPLADTDAGFGRDVVRVRIRPLHRRRLWPRKGV